MMPMAGVGQDFNQLQLPNQIPPLMTINPQSMCVPPPMNGQGFVMPQFFPPDQFNMMMPSFAPGPPMPANVANGGWSAPPPPPPPPPPSSDPAGSATLGQRGSGGSGLESDSRKRGPRAGGGLGSGGLGAGAGGGLGCGPDAEAPRSRGRERRRRGRGRDRAEHASDASGDGGLGSHGLGGPDAGGLGQPPGFGFASGGLDVPHGSLLPRMLPQNGGGDFGAPRAANFAAFGSYGSRSNQKSMENDQNYPDTGYKNVMDYYDPVGPGGPMAMGPASNGALANGSMGYDNNRQRNRRR